MPELPDIVVYIEALEQRISGSTLHQTHIASPFLLRTVDPPISSLNGIRVRDIQRLGKRIVFAFEVRGAAAMAAMDKGALEVLDATELEFSKSIRSENHTCNVETAEGRLASIPGRSRTAVHKIAGPQTGGPSRPLALAKGTF